jgi:hypothetical protein
MTSERFQGGTPLVSPLPPVGFGFVFAGAFLAAEWVQLKQGKAIGPWTLLAGLGGVGFWMFCIYRFHKILRQLSPEPYPISPLAAVGWHFLPFYNLYWMFKWPVRMVKFIRANGPIRTLSGGAIGGLLLLSVLANRFLDGAVGIAGLFSVGLYIRRVLAAQTRHMRAGGTGTSAEGPPETA